MNNPLNGILKAATWIVWGSIFFSLFFYRIYLWGDVSSGSHIDVFFLTMLLVPFLGSLFIRWYLIRKTRNLFVLLILTIAGSAIGESLGFYGIFLFHGHRDLFFIASIVSVGQFIPLYMHRRVEPAAGGDATR